MTTSSPTRPVIPIQRPVLPTFEQVAPYLERMDNSGQYTNFGPLERELRERYARFLNVSPDQVATAANATLALTGAVSITAVDEWICPSFTFPATPASILNAGRKLLFGDIHPETWVLEAEEKSGRGIMPVAPFGAAPDLKKWSEDSVVVHDAAASLGTEPDLSELPKKHSIIFSLHATKVLGAGEGAIVVFGSAESANQFRSWTNFGFQGSRESQLVGTNAKMSEVSAAYAHAALDGWAITRRRWRELDSLLIKLFTDESPKGVSSFATTPYWVTRWEARHTRALAEKKLIARSIDFRFWWGNGQHSNPLYSRYAQAHLPVTDNVVETYLALPIYLGITRSELTFIMRTLN